MTTLATPRRHLLPALMLVVMLAAGLVVPISAQTPAVPASDQLAAVLPAWRDELAGVVASASAAYTIDAEVVLPVSGGSPEIDGTVEMRYTNTTGEAIDQLPFRLYANGPDPYHDTIQVRDVTVDGAGVATTMSDDQTTLSVPLAAPLPPGNSTTVAMAYTLAVPIDENAHYGILNISPESGTWALAHWYPILAGRDPIRGWVLDPPSEFGDPVFSTTASYALTLRTPASWRVVSSGVVTETTQRGAVSERQIVTGPARDLTLVLDDDFESVDAEVDGTRITSWYEPGDERVGEAVLQYAEQALAYFNDLIGPYPYTTLELAPVDLFGAAGVEFPELVYIGSSYYTPDRNLDAPNGLDFTVAHEVLHQWLYGVIGNNQYDDAFIDEGLTNYISSELYFTAMYGPDAGQRILDRYIAGSFESNVTTGNDQIVDTPTDDFPSNHAYVFAVYSKAPMGFKAIHAAIGEDAFAAAMHEYYRDHRFSVATPDDLLAAFEDASGQDLDALWDHWFEQKASEADV